VTKPHLTVARLLECGFTELGCWELNSASELAHRINLPTTAGVYAFAIDGIVQYVGLASRSLRQRLGFYRTPGVSQRTNLRLNAVIRGHLEKGTRVQILGAHPPDQAWNGLSIKGAEGLEAGLIEAFDLPWNMRGSERTAPTSGSARDTATVGGVPERILDLVRQSPGLTELEMARKLFGPSAVQQQVNQHCRDLVKRGRLKRRGAGGATNPFTYHPST
jgi:hypothetical protein